MQQFILTPLKHLNIFMPSLKYRLRAMLFNRSKKPVNKLFIPYFCSHYYELNNWLCHTVISSEFWTSLLGVLLKCSIIQILYGVATCVYCINKTSHKKNYDMIIYMMMSRDLVAHPNFFADLVCSVPKRQPLQVKDYLFLYSSLWIWDTVCSHLTYNPSVMSTYRLQPWVSSAKDPGAFKS